MRILHTMLRVTDLDRAIDFYGNAIGMRELRRHDYTDARFTRVFMGYRDEQSESAIELTHNWDTKSYVLGNAYGHLAIEVDDAAKICERAAELGYRVARAAGQMKHGRNIIAFLEDPDGYKVELIQRSAHYD